MTGKLADTVMSVRNGEQIVRKYQPTVFNPSTQAQVAQRAKMKLMSQLSAVMASVIAIPREGSVSSRNLFTKGNFPLTTYQNDQAEIVLSDVQITKSTVGLGAITGSRTTNGIEASLVPVTARGDFNRVVYALFAKGVDGRLRYITSRTATEFGQGAPWSVTFPLISEDVVILAYGVRDNTNAARAAFGNMEAITAETIAKLVVTRNLTESDITLTETRGVEVSVSSQANHAIEDTGITRSNPKKK